jgi:predicted glycosyltransferase
VLGLREVLDAPDVLAAEWERKGSVAATERFYHDIWIYGLQSIYDPTQGLPFSPAVRARMHWTGYLRRTVPDDVTPPDEPYILVTPGGGGDGEVLVDLVLQAYEKDPELGPPAKFVYGPFLSGDTRRAFEARVEKLDGRVTTVGFESEMEALLSGAQGVICMGGYNTFCEVLSFDKPAVILPRRVPRLEQYIRASKAEELGLCRMLDEERDGLTADAMIAAIAALPDQRPPSAAFVDGLLDGLETVNERVRALLSDRSSCAAE